MNEIELKIGRRVYRVTDQNNGNKYSRAKASAGPNASPKQILAHYEKLGGYIQDGDDKKVLDSQFWKEEKKRLERNEKWNKYMKEVSRITSHPVIASLLVILILASLFYWLGIDLRSFT